MSLFNFIKTNVENDPFSDLSGALESYKAHRSRLQKECDELPKTDMNPSTSTGKPTAPSSSIFRPSPVLNPSVAVEPPKSINIVPTSSASSFGSTDAPSNIFGSSSNFSSTVFAPTTANKSSAFNFGAKPDQPTEHPTSSASATLPEKAPFSFGTPVANSFGASTTNPFGSSPSTSVSHKLDSDRKLPFGNFSSDAAMDKKPSPTISFGTPSSVSKNAGVFFGFGSAPVSTNISTPASVSPSEKETTSEDGMEETGSKVDGEGEPKESVPGLLTPNPHDGEGTGEENEETVHAVKLKAYRMKRADEQGGPGWAELGMGKHSLFFCCFMV